MQKLLVGDRLYLKFGIKVTALERNHRFSLYFHSYRLSRNNCVKGIHWPNYPCKNDWWEATSSTPEILSQSERVGAKFEQ